MPADAKMLERIDIAWCVRTRSVIDTRFGKAAANSTFNMTLGTYDGPMSHQTMAAAINARGVHEGDIDTVMCIDGTVTITEAAEILRVRRLLPEDIVEMVIQDVIVDEKHGIASSVMEPKR